MVLLLVLANLHAANDVSSTSRSGLLCARVEVKMKR